MVAVFYLHPNDRAVGFHIFCTMALLKSDVSCIVISTDRICAIWHERYELPCASEWRNLAALAVRAR